MLQAFLAILIAIPFISAGGTEHWSVGNIFIDDPKIGFRVDIYSPTTPGSYPVLIYLSGLSGVIPATFYTIMLTTIAEQNVIVIAISKIENIIPEKIAPHIGHFFDWIIKPDDGAARLFAEHEAVQGVTPNMTLLGALTHSSAGHAVGQYLNGTCGPVKLLIMMNPVDGVDAKGKIDDFITHPPTPLPFRTPTLIISAGLDGDRANIFTSPCAPNNMSNDRWYRSLYGPTFLVNFTDYGHADNLDGIPAEAALLVCKACKGAICNVHQFKIDEATLVTTFVRAIFNQDVAQLRIIENPSSIIQMHLSNKYDLHNYNYTTGGPGGFCTHD